MIDFHCHIDLYSDPHLVLAKTAASGVYVLAVTTTPRAFPMLRRLAKENPRVRVALGLHPELVSERHQEVDLFPVLLNETDYVGEVGIDGTSEHKASLRLQEKVFLQILTECAAKGGRILSIHSRAAAANVMDCLEEVLGSGTPIFHWFSGNARELERAISMGAWFSVGSAMIRSRKGRELISQMPRDRLLTETDGPFARTGGQPLYPWNVAETEIELAGIWEIHPSEIRQQLRANLSTLATHRKPALGI